MCQRDCSTGCADFADSKTILSLIQRDTALTPAQRERQKESLQEVLRFCNNKTDCRRVQVLAYFNESFNPADCHAGCDVCLSRNQNSYFVEDVTEDAKAVLEMVGAFQADDRITIKNASDCFRGKGGGSGKGLEQNPFFGAGKDWEQGEAERLIQTLMIEGALAEFFLTNGAGWNNAYLKVSLCPLYM